MATFTNTEKRIPCFCIQRECSTILFIIVALLFEKFISIVILSNTKYS